MEQLTPEQTGKPLNRVSRRGTRVQGDDVSLSLLAAGPVADGAHHAFYEVLLPAGASLPGRLQYSSVAVVVQSGEVQVSSRGEIAKTIEPLTRTLKEAQEPIAPEERPALAIEPIPAGHELALRSGEAMTVTGSDLTVRNDGQEPARLWLSAVLDARVMDLDRCFICPRPGEPR